MVVERGGTMDRDSSKGVHRPLGDDEEGLPVIAGGWTRASYAKYLLTPHWKEMAKRKRESVGNVCELCGSKYELHVHHRHYDTLGHEELSDLQVLCRPCHEDEEDIRGER